MWKELVQKVSGHDKKVQQERTITILPGIVVTIPRENLPFFQDIQWNLRYAEEQGIKILSFNDIAKQINPKDLKKTVLFDIPYEFFPGNHWRITGRHEEQQTISLQLCRRFGIPDYEWFPEITIPSDTPMFTGTAIESFTYDGESLTLEEASQIQGLYPSVPLENLGKMTLHEDILFSDGAGVLKS